jgi:hypothetical protein
VARLVRSPDPKRAGAHREPGAARVDAQRFAHLVFGIPLSFGALITGVLLGLGTKWGVFRYPWVTTTLC